MVEASSHVPLYSLVESTQMVYGVNLCVVSQEQIKDIIIITHTHAPLILTELRLPCCFL
jgi:hypothetical protein